MPECHSQIRALYLGITFQSRPCDDLAVIGDERTDFRDGIWWLAQLIPNG